MAPWLAAFDDNLEILHGTDESCHGSIDYVKERANIQFKSLNFMRGRSFNNAYVIIDEAQGLTQFQLKSVISRVGADSKIVVLGNLAQIDNKYITPLTSGLTYLVEGFKHFEHAGIMHVNGIERSRLAAFAEENEVNGVGGPLVLERDVTIRNSRFAGHFELKLGLHAQNPLHVRPVVFAVAARIPAPGARKSGGQHGSLPGRQGRRGNPEIVARGRLGTDRTSGR